MLYIVATPIGNLKDFSHRAKEVLETVDFIVCEDTRVTSKLLASYQIKKPLKTIHQHSTDTQISSIIKEIDFGKQAAYVSDAGTPGVNDPGGKLVAAAHNAGVEVVPVPGPSALSSAISVCGFPMEQFMYLGFVPHKKGRQTFFKDVAAREDPVIFFESTHRLLKTIEALKEHLASERLVCLCREMTKIHETVYRGTAEKVLEALKASSVKGESVIVVGPEKYRD